jgi:flagellar assembly protein FliH
MSARFNLAGASVSPFQFPPLNEPAPAKVNGAAAPPDAALAPAQDPAHGEALAAELAGGYAEGAQRGFEEGRRQGYAAGFAEGKTAAEETLAEQARRLTSLVAGFNGAIPALARPVEEAVAALALEVARCVIGDEVKRSHAFLVRLIREAIAKVPLEMGAPRVVVNPADLDLIRQLAPDIESGNATLLGDEAIELGGCIVVADGEDKATKDRRWAPRAAEGVSQVDLTLPSRWRSVMLTLFDGEDE